NSGDSRAGRTPWRARWCRRRRPARFRLYELVTGRGLTEASYTDRSLGAHSYSLNRNGPPLRPDFKNPPVSSAANIASLPKGMPQNASGIIPLDAIDNPILQQGLAYWHRLRGQRPYPARADLMPRDLSPLLRHVVLLRVLDGGGDYEYRIV